MVFRTVKTSYFNYIKSESKQAGKRENISGNRKEKSNKQTIRTGEMEDEEKEKKKL